MKLVQRAMVARYRMIVALAAVTAFAVPAMASQASMGTVYGVMAHDTGNAFFYQTGTRTTRPTCATEDRWVFGIATPTGQAMMATLLTAYATGRNVTIQGTGVCSVWPDTETVQSIVAW
ncbi:hypothetical protein ACIQTU_05970 [Brevundimonas sp. NPDC090276]|uniref:hypothetical protein n=1 Tax=Brevundimonas sp. NPDC090276 TaxID=3363956 RepID=UPI00383ADE7F